MLYAQFPGVNHKRVYRLYSEAHLSVLRRMKVKRAASVRVPPQLAQGADEGWSLDFVSDSLANGRTIKFLMVFDDLSHECVDITSGQKRKW
jgi:putative transposase